MNTQQFPYGFGQANGAGQWHPGMMQPPKPTLVERLGVFSTRLKAAAKAFRTPSIVEVKTVDDLEFPLGFYLEDIPSDGAVHEVISRPQVCFRGERLLIPAKIARYFDIMDLKVGRNSQLVNSTRLPAEMFEKNAVGMRMKWETASVAQDITICVFNRSKYKRTFRASLVGTAAL